MSDVDVSSLPSDCLHPTLKRDLPHFDTLAAIALNLRWSWKHQADYLWKTLSPELWESTRNPWVVLQTVSREKWDQAFSSPHFQNALEGILLSAKEEDQAPTWFSSNYPDTKLRHIAYFSMEFMLTEALPIYSGGLGNVAGDQLKAASDLGVPVIGIGLLYQQGYFRQVIGKDGRQQALFPYNDPGQLPIAPLRQRNGEWLRIEIPFPGHSVWLRAWRVQVGRNVLYLLDSNDAANFPAYRGITSELYGGNLELRLRQELVLGLGGWRLLEQLGITPEVCHLNEGHAAFAVLEKARSCMEHTGVSFDTALTITRGGTLFTTHTAVEAGFDRFPPEMIAQYLGRYAAQQLRISLDELLALGRATKDPGEPFNMANLALRGSSALNGVSQLHACVSRQLFAPLFPYWPIDEIPVGSVTNGVHIPSWDSIEADTMWTAFCGKERWLGETEKLDKKIAQIPDTLLWQMRTQSRQTFVEFVRKRVAKQRAQAGSSFEEIARAETLFRPDICTLGFARRFATYKRPNLLLQKPERLLRLINNTQHPIQIVLAGKAHPADKAGQELIYAWNQFIKLHEVHEKIIFLSDYDMQLTEQMVQGVDVWLNTPERPWEACGTSGMKVLVNGGLNISALDGWWAEAFSPDAGWALGMRNGGSLTLDEAADELYDCLEQEVLPTFYRQEASGLPIDWVMRMRQSMSHLTPHFSANRAVREYTTRYYLPASERMQERTHDHHEGGRRLSVWKKTMQTLWKGVSFGARRVQRQEDRYFFEITIDINGLSTDNVHVELYRQAAEGKVIIRQPMQLAAVDVENQSVFLYRAEVLADCPDSHYTARAYPVEPLLQLPLESPEILWQETAHNGS